MISINGSNINQNNHYLIKQDYEYKIRYNRLHNITYSFIIDLLVINGILY
jgi:hypothetical protein